MSTRATARTTVSRDPALVALLSAHPDYPGPVAILDAADRAWLRSRGVDVPPREPAVPLTVLAREARQRKAAEDTRCDIHEGGTLHTKRCARCRCFAFSSAYARRTDAEEAELHATAAWLRGLGRDPGWDIVPRETAPIAPAPAKGGGKKKRAARKA